MAEEVKKERVTKQNQGRRRIDYELPTQLLTEGRGITRREVLFVAALRQRMGC